MSWRRRAAAWGFVLGVCMAGLLACGEGMDRERLGSRRDAVINGDFGDMWEIEEGHVCLHGGTGNRCRCSGTLVWKNWVLTAKHCFTNTQLSQPSLTKVRMANQNATATKIVGHPFYDIALLKMDKSFTIPTSKRIMHCTIHIGGNSTCAWVTRRRQDPYQRNWVTWRMGIYQDSAKSLVGKTLRCFGYGWFNSGGGADGRLRKANLHVFAADAPKSNENFYYILQNNERGQILANGDSGGSCFIQDRYGRWLLTGVASRGTSLNQSQIPTEAFRDWMNIIWMQDTVAPSKGEALIVQDLNRCLGSPWSQLSRCLASRNPAGSSRYTLPLFQRWAYYANGRGGVNLVQKATGMCLTAKDADRSDNAVFVVAPCGENLGNQRFLKNSKGGIWASTFIGQRLYRTSYEFKALHSGKCLESDAGRLVQRACRNTTSQRFYTMPGEGYWPKSGGGSGQVVLVADSSLDLSRGTLLYCRTV